MFQPIGNKIHLSNNFADLLNQLPIMHHTLLSLILFLVSQISFSNQVSAQKNATKYAAEQKADSLRERGMNELAIEQYKEVISQLEPQHKTSDLARLYIGLGFAYVFDFKLEEAEEVLLKVDSLNALTEDEYKLFRVANGLNLKGALLHKQDQFTQAKEAYLQAIDIYKTLPDGKLHLGKAFINISSTLANLHELDSSTYYANEAILLLKNITPLPHRDIATIYNRLGDIQMSKELFDSAILFLSKSLEYDRMSGEKDYPKMIPAINNIAISYKQKGNYQKALFYYQTALNISNDHGDLFKSSILIQNMSLTFAENGEPIKALEYANQAHQYNLGRFGPEHPRVAYTHRNLGAIYADLDEFEKAIEHHRNAVKIEAMHYGPMNIYVGWSYGNIGNVYLKLQKYDSALHYHQKALSIVKHNAHGDNVDVAYTLLDLGNTYKKLGDLKKAKESWQQSLDIFSESFGNKHPAVANVYYQMASNSFAEQSFVESLKFIQTGLQANVPDFASDRIQDNPKVNSQILEASFFLKTLHLKAQVLAKTGHEALAINTFYSCDSLVSRIREDHLRHEDKLSLGELSTLIFQDAVDFCISRYEATSDPKFLELAYHFGEKSKSATLTSNVLSSQARSFANIPASLIEKERDLTIDLTFYQSEKVAYSQGHHHADESQLQKIEQKIFKLNQSLDSLREHLKSRYYNYYELNFIHQGLPVKEVQSKLDSKVALLEYIQGRDELYVLVITKNSIESQRLVPLDELTKLETQWQMHALQPKTTLKAYLELSHKWFSSLLKEPLALLDHQVNQLLIVPEARHALLPWGIFPMRKEGTNFKEVPYLLKRYDISYGYSAKLAFNEPNKSSNPTGNLLAYAPSYSSESGNEAVKEVFRSELNPLKWNVPEVQSIGTSFESDVVLQAEATERHFKQQAANFRILHLAMHALVDHEESMNSKLVFTQNNDSIEDGMLHTFELFNMNLQAEMVVLSACNTGIGTVKKGEGVMSLARGFAYAGVPSLVMSHWNINDESTSILMTQFYQYLAEGERKDVALRKAKLNFLENANEIQANPFYWGGFVIVGDTSPINNYQFNYWALLLVIPPLVLFRLSRKKR